MSEQRFLQIRVSEEMKNALKEKADSEGRTITEVVLRLVQQYVDGSIVLGFNDEVAALQQKIQQMEASLGEHSKVLRQHSFLLGESAA